MAIDRRALLGGAVASAVLPDVVKAVSCGQEILAASCREADGRYAAVLYDRQCGIVQRVGLPARGHDLVQRPGTADCVALARRPGTFGVVFGFAEQREPQFFHAAPGRSFFGHGAFSPDGRLLFTTEEHIPAGQGVIGVRDATGGYRQIGEFPSGGIGPHDVALLSDGKTLVVANGGLDTGGGREALNVATMQPSLTYIDRTTGEIAESHTLPGDLHKLSIRHLAVGARDTVVIGCQNEGPPDEHPAIVAFHRRGERLELLSAPVESFRSLRNYVGSVSADSSGEFAAATSPRGGCALIIDVAQRRLIEERRLADICGIAPRHQAGQFLATSGHGAVEAWQVGDSRPPWSERERLAWDNHAILLAV